MSIVYSRGVLALACVLALSFAACGGGEKAEDRVEEASKVGTVQSEQALAAAPMRTTIEGAGFTVVGYRPFSPQLPARIGSVVVYRSASGKQGGLLYFQKSGRAKEDMYWHWYFDDAAPDSARTVELNDDGLWDVRIFFSGGKTADYVQGEDFTFTGIPRRDLIAMNGASSEAADLWKCFDGDTTSAWVADVSKGKAYVELATPFGVETGVLTLRAESGRSPRSVEVLVDGAKVKELELADTGRQQSVQLESVGPENKSVRLVFKSGHAGDTVAVTELSIK